MIKIKLFLPWVGLSATRSVPAAQSPDRACGKHLVLNNLKKQEK
jgi:hypothetical protein